MNTHPVIRAGAFAAIASAVLYLATMAIWMSAGAAGPPPAALAAYIASQLFFLVTLFALYRLLQDEAPVLSLIGALALAASTAASFFIDLADLNNPLALLMTILYGGGLAILGWLAYRSPRLSRAIGIAALAAGALTLAMAPIIVAGSAELVGFFNMVVSVLFVVWLALLAWRLLRGPAAVAQSA
jgi:hypothetical protein